MSTFSQAVQVAALTLRRHGVPSPVRDARLLLARAARLDLVGLTLRSDEEIAAKVSQRFDDMIALRCKRVPSSQILGQREFYGRSFRITQQVLDPRPETECLVAAALRKPFNRVLDLGVGSGAIIISLLKENLSATGLGVDQSDCACQQARENAIIHDVENRVELLKSNWFSKVMGRFDLIVANPPYIAADELANLCDEVRLHEPIDALTDGGDGLSAYREICHDARKHLLNDGRLIFEIDPKRRTQVEKILHGFGFEDREICPDLAGQERIIVTKAGNM